MHSKDADKNPTSAKATAGRPTIFVFTTAYDPFIGGAEIAIKEVTKRLKDKYRFFIFTSRFRRDLPKYEERSGVVILRIGFGSKLDKFLVPFWGFFVARRFAQKEKPIIFWAVMASYASGVPYLINFFRFGRKTPVVLTLQEGDTVNHILNAKFGLIGTSWKAALQRTDHLTAISNFLLNLGEGFGYKGPGRVIPNGVDISLFTKEFASDELSGLRQVLKIEQGEFVVITTSRLVEKNAVDISIRAIAALIKEGLKIKFLVLGSGGLDTELKKLTEDLDAAGKILFLGDIRYSEIPKYLKISDVFLRPSRSEGLGNSFIEAMAVGVPIIGTLVGGITDFLEDGKTGLAVKVDSVEDCANRIELLIKNEKLRREIGREGKKFALTRFGWDMIAEEYAKVFTAVSNQTCKVKLLIATGIFPPDIGGPATYSKLLLDELPNHGFLVDVLSFGRVRHFPRVIRHLVYLCKLAVKSLRADVIFTQDPVSVGFPAVVVAKIFRKPFLLKIVGDYAWEQHQQKVQSSKFKVQSESVNFKSVDEFQDEKFDFVTEVRRKVQRLVAKRADKIIVPSEYLKRIVSQWGGDKSKIVVIYNSFEPPKLKVTKMEARRKLGLSGSIAVSVGRLVPWKGFSALIESVAMVRKYIHDFKLFIIGSGPDFESLKLKVKSLKLEDCVYLTDGVPHEDVLTCFVAADVFILNTAYEGFSHTILEAMAMGIPVITTPVGGNAEIIRNGENGILVLYNNTVEISEALRRVLGDSVLRDRFSASARVTASQFTKEKMLEETIAVLRTVL